MNQLATNISARDPMSLLEPPAWPMVGISKLGTLSVEDWPSSFFVPGAVIYGERSQGRHRACNPMKEGRGANLGDEPSLRCKPQSR